MEAEDRLLLAFVEENSLHVSSVSNQIAKVQKKSEARFKVGIRKKLTMLITFQYRFFNIGKNTYFCMLIALEIFIYIFCSFTASCCAVLGFFLRYKFTKHLKNMRKALFLLFMFASVQLVTAQTDFARSFSSGGGMAGNVGYAIGLPFFSQPETDNCRQAKA